MTKTRPRMFYGWWVVVACAFALFLGPIPIMIFSFGVFLRPLVQEFHTGRGAISFAFTLQTTIPAFVLPFTGRLIDRVGAKRVIVLSTVLAAFILMSAYFCSGKIWHLYLFYVALGITAAGLAPVSYAHAIAHWFDRFRGLALSCTMAGLGVGALIMPTVAQQ
ncbi:MAG: MFS transporter, partial [Acidobacteriaceae bacterium]|nr:MFS transporter [Acidobacteriaceae bacterium]